MHPKNKKKTMMTYPSDAIIADGKQLLQTMHALYDAQRKAPIIVNEQLLGITLIPEASLWLYRATKTNDTSYFYVCKRGERRSEECLEHIRDIQPFVIIPDTNPLQAIWRIYLLGKAHTQLPANWHGNYVQATLILEASDMESIQPIDRTLNSQLFLSERTKVFANRDWNIIAPIEELQPKVVTLNENTYQVVCCYWNNWEGFVRETVTYVVENATIMTKDSKLEVLYPYYCDVMF